MRDRDRAPLIRSRHEGQRQGPWHGLDMRDRDRAPWHGIDIGDRDRAPLHGVDMRDRDRAPDMEYT